MPNNEEEGPKKQTKSDTKIQIRKEAAVKIRKNLEKELKILKAMAKVVSKDEEDEKTEVVATEFDNEPAENEDEKNSKTNKNTSSVSQSNFYLFTLFRKFFTPLTADKPSLPDDHQNDLNPNIKKNIKRG